MAQAPEVTRDGQADRPLGRARSAMERAIDAAPLVAFELDRRDRISRWNLAAADVLGWSPGEVLGRPAAATVGEPAVHMLRAAGGDHGTAVTAPLTTASGATVELEFRIAVGRRHLGRPAPLLAVQHPAGPVTRPIAIRYSLHDPLTGLPNRLLFADRVEQALARAGRTRGSVAVLYCDIDGFKGVNDRHGHLVGDEVLRRVAGRLADRVRRSDTVARLGGDEFGVLLADPADRRVTRRHALLAASTVADDVHHAFVEPVVVAGCEFRLSVSVGVAVVDHRTSVEGVVADADRAMYAAKRAGGGQTRVFDEDLERWRRWRDGLTTEGSGGPAAAVVSSRPVRDLVNGTAVGAHLSVGWRTPDGTLHEMDRLPAMFDPAVEPAVGRYVVDAALGTIERRTREGSSVWVSVPVSGGMLRGDRIDRLRDALVDRAIDPQRLVVRLPEAVLVEALDETRQLVDRLRALGVRTAIDDFGSRTGALGALASIPFDFVAVPLAVPSSHEPNALGPVQEALVEVVHRLGPSVLVTGLAEHDHRRLLARGCRYAVGPLAARSVEQLPRRGGAS